MRRMILKKANEENEGVLVEKEVKTYYYGVFIGNILGYYKIIVGFPSLDIRSLLSTLIAASSN